MKDNVCFFYDADYPSNQAGGEKRLFMIAQELIAENHKVSWVSFNFWKDKSFTHNEYSIKHIGILPKPKFYNKNGDRTKSEPILYLINCLLAIPYFINTKIWVIGQWPMVHIIPLIILGKILRKKIYVEWWETLGDQWYKKGIAGKLGNFIEHSTLFTSSFIDFIVDCESEKELLRLKNSRAKVQVISNGVDINFFAKNKDEIKFDFVSMARLKNHKRVDLLIEATRKFIDKTNNQDIRIAIIGDGPEKNKLESLTKQLRLEKNITFFGFVKDYSNAVSILLSSQVGVLTTVAGGKGSVLINELFAAELPVLAIGSEDGIDRRYIKDDENGFITNNISSDELADLMVKILLDVKKLDKMKIKLANNKHKLDWKIQLKNHPVLSYNK